MVKMIIFINSQHEGCRHILTGDSCNYAHDPAVQRK